MTAADCLFRSARDKFDDGDYPAALELARAGLLRDAWHPGLLQVSGRAAYQLDAPLEALNRLEAASVVAPLDPLARVALADLYLRYGQRTVALVMLKFQAEPDRCPTALMADLARLLGRAGAYRAALRVCRRLIRARPWYHPAHYGAAFYLTQLRRSAARVERHLRAAHELAPDAVPYRAALAGVLERAGRFEDACDLIRDVPLAALDCPACLKRLRSAAVTIGDVPLATRLRDRLREVLAARRDEPDEPFDVAD